MIVLIGTGHIFDMKTAVSEIIKCVRPRFVCLELDKARFNALMAEQQKNKRRSVSKTRGSVIYALLSKAQEKFAKKFAGHVGGEMVAAAACAKDMGAEVVLMDLDAQQVVAEYWRSASLREKFKVMFGAIISVFTSKDKIRKEIEQYYHDPEGYIEDLGKSAPELKRMLIDNRNEHMANVIMHCALSGDVVAVMGDGHIPGVMQILERRKLAVEAIRFEEIIKGTWKERLAEVLSVLGAAIGGPRKGDGDDKKGMRAQPNSVV